MKPHQFVLCVALLAAGCAAPDGRAARSNAVVPDADAAYAVCADCHGPRGEGRTDGSVPRIAGQRFSALVRQLSAFNSGKRWDDRETTGAAPHALPDRQSVTRLAAYLADLDVGAERGIGDGLLSRFGGESYAQHCVRCHGPEGEGRDEAVPRIGGQHYRYLVRVLYETSDGRRKYVPPGHRALLSGLDYDEVLGIADFLSRMQWQGSGTP